MNNTYIAHSYDNRLLAKPVEMEKQNKTKGNYMNNLQNKTNKKFKKSIKYSKTWKTPDGLISMTAL